MSNAGAATGQFRTRVVVWTAVCAGLLLVLIANSHLVYVAVISQPECVAHLRQGEGPAKDVPAAKIEAGKAVFAANCVGCHGDDAKGNAELGAPDLTDRSWIYGGDAESVYDTVWGGRQGHMPSWDGRLSPLDRKILALYLFDLRRSER